MPCIMRGMDTKSAEPLYLSCPAVALAATDGNAPPTQFSGTAYSGDAFNYWGLSVIDLSSTTIARDRTPALMEHQRDQRVGTCTLTITDAGIQVGDGKLLSNPDAQRVAADAKDGFEFQFSIGLFNFSYEDVPSGVNTTVNGKTFSGPITVLRNGTVREVSFVALGADTQTHSRLFSQPNPKDSAMDLAQAQQKIRDLEAQNATLTEQLATKTAEHAALSQAIEKERKDARAAQIKADFAALGWEYSEDAAKPYAGLSADAYGAIIGKFKAEARRLPEGLFREQATHGTDGGADGKDGNAELKMPDPMETYAKRAEQARKGH